MSKEIFNIKKEYNWCGDIAEILVKHQFKAQRTKGYSFDEIVYLNSEMNSFLKNNWSSIDLYKLKENKLILFEVKSRTEDVKRRPDLTNKSLDCYTKALKLGIKVYFITVFFAENWNIYFEKKEFKKSLFRINDGGWYKKIKDRLF